MICSMTLSCVVFRHRGIHFHATSPSYMCERALDERVERWLPRSRLARDVRLGGFVRSGELNGWSTSLLEYVKWGTDTMRISSNCNIIIVYDFAAK